MARIAGVDLPRDKSIQYALPIIYGIGKHNVVEVLEKAGIVHVRREGRSSFYRLDRDRVRAVLTGYLAQLEEASPEKTWAPSGPRTTRELAERAATQKKGTRT